MLASMYARSGMVDSARVLLEAARTASQADSSASWFLLAEANVRLLLGEKTPALRLIARVLETNAQLGAYISRAPWFRSLRNDAEFMRLVGKTPNGSVGAPGKPLSWLRGVARSLQAHG
jgi:hypothetical protein